MTLKELNEELTQILKVHPDAADAAIWTGRAKDALPVLGVGYDRRHKPARIKLETQ